MSGIELRAWVYTAEQLGQALGCEDISAVYVPMRLAGEPLDEYADRVILLPPEFLGDCEERIEQELYRKGVSRDVVSDTLEQLSFDEDALPALIERRYLRQLDTEKGVQKTVAALQRMGYSFGEIRDALRKVQEDV